MANRSDWETLKISLTSNPLHGSALVDAAEANDTEMAELLLSKNADATQEHTSDKYKGWGALHFAAHHGNIYLIKLLLTKVNPNQQFGNGPTPLQRSTRNNQPEAVDILLQTDCLIMTTLSSSRIRQ